MDSADILLELSALLEQNGVVVRRQSLGGGGGGLCKIKDKTVFFVDTECSATEMAVICARAVNETLDAESVYIKPQVRQFLEKYCNI